MVEGPTTAAKSGLCRTSLDSWKTSETEHSKNALAQEHVFGTEAPARDLWHQAIAADPLSIKHLQRYESCGTNAWIQENHTTGRTKVAFNTCKLRCCPVCLRIAARRIKHRLETALLARSLKKWRLITLTQIAQPEPLTASITRLRLAFKKLRKSENWSKYITGGYAILEITRNALTGLWHCHFHIVAGGLYYPWQQLREDWSLVAGGATVTDIRAIKTTAGAIHYLTAYLGKLFGADQTTPLDALTEYYRTIHGQRLLISFGAAPPPAKEKKPNSVAEWHNICPLWKYVIALREGFTWALALQRRLQRQPLGELDIADWHPPPDF